MRSNVSFMRDGISADNAYLAVFLKVMGDASGEQLSEVIVNQVFHIGRPS